MAVMDWGDIVESMKAAGAVLARTWQPDSGQNRAELHRQLMMNLALGYLVYFGADADHPQFIPFLNSLFLLQPNPDDTYFYAPVRAGGTYRVSGERGGIHLLTLTQGGRMIGMAEQPGGQFGEHDIGSMARADGTLDIVLSAERPAGITADWLALDPRADFLFVRQRSYRWGQEQDARLAIECLDNVAPAARPPAAEIEAKLCDVIGFSERLSRQWADYNARLKATQAIHEFHFTGFTELGGVRAQIYWQAIFELADDEALILETDLPQTVRYWNVQLNDQLWNTIGFVDYQSSLNGAQAHIDDDGKFRAVITTHADPGVVNWLDTVQRETGTIIGRWYEASDHPEPKLTKVKLAELGAHLPAGTPVVSVAQRRALLLARSRGAQMRRRW